MANPTETIAMCKSILNSDYKGDPLELKSFINKIQMLNTLITNVNKPTLFAFVKTKLASKAFEVLKLGHDNIPAIIASLRERIKPESANVVMGKLAALRLANRPLQDFAKQAEELVEHLKRSLVFEGFPEHKAQKMTIEKTVAVCRETAHSDIVKSVLSASNFVTPQKVVAKFITECDKSRSEKQVLAIRQFNRNWQNGKGQA